MTYYVPLSTLRSVKNATLEIFLQGPYHAFPNALRTVRHAAYR